MTGSISAVQALIIALWVAIVQSRGLGYSTLTLRFSPLMTGLVCGLVMGNVAQAMIITTAIQLMYMGAIAPGGTMPTEPAVATAIAVPVALMANLDPAAAVVVALPVGILGSYLYQFRFFLNTMVVRFMDKAAAETNDNKLFFTIIVVPILISLALFTPLIFIALYFGGPALSDVMLQLGESWVFSILKVIGGGLAALGIALIIHVIGKKSLLVYFFLAYFMSVALKPLGINTVTYAVFGIIAAVLYITFTKSGKSDSASA